MSAKWELKEKSIGDMTVTVDGEEWKEAVDKAFRKICKNVTINGFRKGQAPAALLEKRVSMQERQAEAVDDNANKWLREGLEELKLEPIDRPTLDVKAMNETSVELVYTFPVMPAVTLGQYKGLTYKAEDETVSDEDMQKELDNLRERYSEWEVKEEPAENGDTVNIDYEGYKGDEKFDGGSAQNYNLELGSNSFIPGFEEGLVGVKAGDEKDLPLTFPEDYPAENLKGAEVIFKVKVNEVKKKILPELDDDFAQDANIPDVKTVDELKAKVRERLEAEKKDTAERHQETALEDQLLANTKMDLPDVLVEQEVDSSVQSMANQLKNSYQISLNDYLKMTNTSMESLRASQRIPAEKNVKLRLILAEIAKEENLTASEEDIDKEIQDIAEAYQMKAEDVKPLLDQALLKEDILNQKAYDLVKGSAVAEAEETAAPAEEKPAEEASDKTAD